MMSGWLDFLGLVAMISCTLGSSSTNTMNIAIVGIMGIVVVGIANHTFTFKRNSILAILDYM